MTMTNTNEKTDKTLGNSGTQADELKKKKRTKNFCLKLLDIFQC